MIARVRAAATLVALVVQATAALAGDECAAPAQRAYFAAAGFYRGDAATDLVGNAFVIFANAGPLCRAPGASADCAPNDNRRTWHAQLVTAAHVVMELCEARPDKADNWSPGRLILNPGYALESRRPVEVVLDAAWCDANKGAGARLSGKPVAIDANARGSEVIDREHVDLWIFAATFLLPQRALISPYTLDLLPPKGTGANVQVQGFSPTGTSTSESNTLGSHPVFFGKGPANPVASTRALPKYKIAATVFHGQSGSPVGFFPDEGPERVFGVLVETGSTTCAKIEDERRQQLIKKLVAAGLSPADADDDKVRGACYDDERARKEMHQQDQTAYFVPLVRNPRFIRDAYDKQLRTGDIDARVEAALSLYADPDHPRTDDFNGALRLIMQGLTTIQQLVVIERIKARNPRLDDNAITLLHATMCEHLEPQAVDGSTGVP